jgi:predicted KAP-like P-loop ATPase
MSTGYPDVPVLKYKDNKFHTNTYVDVLTDFIRTCDTPMTIAIQGDWGTGKTSMMNMIQEKLDNKVKSVMFNTWQYKTKIKGMKK